MIHAWVVEENSLNIVLLFRQLDSDIELSNSESDREDVFGDNEDEGDDDDDDDNDRPQRPGSGRRQSPVFVFGGPSGEAQDPPLHEEPEQVENDEIVQENEQVDPVRSPLRGQVTKRNFWRMFFDVIIFPDIRKHT